MLLPALALSIPIFDTLFTLVRRGILQRRSLFSAERGHIHHRLMDVGLCHRHVVLLLYSVTFLGAGVALISLLGSAWATGITAVAFCCGLNVLFRTADTVRGRRWGLSGATGRWVGNLAAIVSSLRNCSSASAMLELLIPGGSMFAAPLSRSILRR